MWNGVFSPRVIKHRDYAHNTYFEHEMANGAEYELCPVSVKVDTDPIDDSPYEPSEDYYMMDFRPHSGDKYLYLIPSEPDNSEPNFVRIRDTMDAYARNPVEGGRDWRDYIDFEESDIPVDWLVEHGYEEQIDYRFSLDSAPPTVIE